MSDTAPGALLINDVGRVTCATPAATRLLELLAAPEELSIALRALHARATMAGEQPIVIGLPVQGGGRLVMTGAWAGHRLMVVIQPHGVCEQAAKLARFTARERDVLDLINQGLPTKRIATLLKISPWTVADHLKVIYAKAGVTSRGELMALTHGRAAA
jgi:DNA-binding CsgD family transcriptional regulator